MATWHKAAEDINFTMRRTGEDWDSQHILFQCEQFTKTYDPTQAQWNYLKTGYNAFISSMPNVTGALMPDYDPAKHLHPGQWD